MLHLWQTADIASTTPENNYSSEVLYQMYVIYTDACRKLLDTANLYNLFSFIVLEKKTM